MHCSDVGVAGSDIFVYSIVLIILSLTSVEANCPGNSTKVDDYCYEVFDQVTDWESAVTICQENGGFMALPTTPERQTALHQLTYTSGEGTVFWAPLIPDDSGNLLWVGPAEFPMVSDRLLPWQMGPEFNGTRDSVVMFISGIGLRFSYTGFDASAKYICEWLPDNQIQTMFNLTSDNGDVILSTTSGTWVAQCVTDCLSTENCTGIGLKENTTECILLSTRNSNTTNGTDYFLSYTITDCPMLTSVASGNVTSASTTTATTIGSVLHYTCNPLYHKAGTARITCQPNGRWSGYPSCMSDIPCPDGWEDFKGSCYHVSPQSSPWDEARETCGRIGGFLVELNDQGEMDYINMVLDRNRSETFWSGGNDLFREGFYSWWRDLYTRMAYTKWIDSPVITSPSVMTNNEADCIALQRTINGIDEGQYYYMESKCDLVLQFVCEKERIHVGGYNCSLFEQDACSGPSVCLLDKCVCPEMTYIQVGEDGAPTTACQNVLPVGGEGCGSIDDSCLNISICVSDRCQCPPDTYQNGQNGHYGTTCETTELQCPGGWKTNGDFCFRLNTKLLTMEEAEAECAAMGGYLAKASSEQQNDFIVLMGERNTVWIGAHTRYGLTRGLLWGDETPATFTNWAIDPWSPGENICVSVNLLGVWAPQPCDHRLPSVCHIPQVCPVLMANNFTTVEPDPSDPWAREVGRSLQITCDTGYTLTGTHTQYIHCNHNNGMSTWGNIPDCINMIEAWYTNLTNSDNFARLTKATGAFGIEECAMECSDDTDCGMISVRESDDVCKLFSPPTVTSTGPSSVDLNDLANTNTFMKKSQVCPAVPHVNNALIHSSGRSVADTVTYKCWPGFQMADMNKAIIECQQNGTWQEPPFCSSRFRGEPSTAWSLSYTKYIKHYSVLTLRECQERCINDTAASCKMVHYNTALCELSSLGRNEVELGVIIAGEGTVSVITDLDLDEFQVYDGRYMSVPTNTSIPGVSLEICAQACLSEKTFYCESFDYTNSNDCQLYSQTDPGLLLIDTTVQHYSRFIGCPDPVLPMNLDCQSDNPGNSSGLNQSDDTLRCHCTVFGEEIAADHSGVIRCNSHGTWDSLPKCRNLCLSGWFMSDHTCYTVMDGSYSFWDAIDTCQSQSAASISITNTAVTNFVEQIRLSLGKPPGQYWTGLYRETGSWQWTDRTFVNLTFPLQTPLNSTQNTAVVISLPDNNFNAAQIESVQTGVVCKKAALKLACPTGWKYLNSTCYTLQQTLLPLASVASSCSLIGGYPASIHSQHELNTLIYMRNEVQPSAVVWLGLEKDPVTLWKWLDGSTIDFLYWQDKDSLVTGVSQCATLGNYALVMRDCAGPHMSFCHAPLGEIGESTDVADIPCSSDAFCQSSDYRCMVDNSDETLTTLPTCRLKGCPSPWVSRDGKCYYFNEIPASYVDASGKCISMGGYLTRIDSLYEENFITETVQRLGWMPESVWIGLDKIGSSNFIWMDGETTPSYSHWAVGQPDNQNTDKCASLSSLYMTGAWYDVKCHTKLPFVCQKKPDSDTQGGFWYESCFKESNSKSTWDILDTYYTDPGMTVETCKAHCQSKGFKYAALMAGEVCKCGNTRGRHGRVAEGDCQTPCKGNNSQLCGGTSAMSVFRLQAGHCTRTMTSNPAEPNICYTMSQHQETWLNARHQCQEQGGDLLTPSTPERYDYIRDKVLPMLRIPSSSREVWLGLSQSVGSMAYPEQPFSWLQRNTAQWLYWGDLQPSDTKDDKYSKDCVSVLPDNRWADRNCGNTNYYICEFNDNAAPQTGEKIVHGFLDFEDDLKPQVGVPGIVGLGRSISVNNPLHVTSSYLLSCLNRHSLCQTDFTFMFWFKIQTITEDMTIFATGDCESVSIGSEGMCMIYYADTSTLVLILANDSSTFTLQVSIDPVFWNHVAIFKPKNSLQFQVYLNNELLDSWLEVNNRLVKPHLEFRSYILFGGMSDVLSDAGQFYLDDVFYINRRLLDTELSVIFGDRYGQTKASDDFRWMFDTALHYNGEAVTTEAGIKNTAIVLSSLGSEMILDPVTLSCNRDLESCPLGFTYSFWTKYLGQSDKTIVTTGLSNPSHLTVRLSPKENKLQIIYKDSMATEVTEVALDSHQWHHVVITKPTLSAIIVYVDGKLTQSETRSDAIPANLGPISPHFTLGSGLCPLRWVYHERACYSVPPVSMSYEAAIAYCSSYFSHLIVISTDMEFDFLSSLLQNRSPLSAFVGMHDADPGPGREWRTIRGFPQSILTSAVNVDGQLADRCMVAETNHSSTNCNLRIVPCSSVNHFICQLDKDIRTDGFQSEGKECPISWLRKEDRCYKVMTSGQSHPQAQVTCGSLDGQLAQIHNEAEQQAVTDVIYGTASPSTFYYFGLRQVTDIDNMWTYWDRQGVEYTAWNSLESEPSSSGNCAAFNCDFGLCQWHAVPCEELHHFVCERQAETSCSPGWMTRGGKCIGKYHMVSGFVHSGFCTEVNTQPLQLTNAAEALHTAILLDLDNIPCMADGLIVGDKVFWNTTMEAVSNNLLPSSLPGTGQCLGVNINGLLNLPCDSAKCIICEYERNTPLYVDNLGLVGRALNDTEVYESFLNEEPLLMSYYISFDGYITSLVAVRHEQANISSVPVFVSSDATLQGSPTRQSYLSLTKPLTSAPALFLDLSDTDICFQRVTECLSGFTVSFWVYVSNASQANLIKTSGGNTGFSLFTNKTAHDKLKLVFEVSETHYTWRVKSYLPTEHWVHLTALWHRFAGMKLFINSQLISHSSTPFLSAPVEPKRNNIHLVIGEVTSDTTLYLDEVYIVGAVRDTVHVIDEYNKIQQELIVTFSDSLTKNININSAIATLIWRNSFFGDFLSVVNSLGTQTAVTSDQMALHCFFRIELCNKPLSLSLWLRPHDLETDQEFLRTISLTSDQPSVGIQLSYSSIADEYYQDVYVNKYRYRCVFDLRPHLWSQVIIVFQPVGPSLTLYIDGKLGCNRQTSTYLPERLPGQSMNGRLEIGRHGHFDIDDVRIYDKVLQSSSIYVLPSCHQYKLAGFRGSRHLTVDPDGDNPILQPLQVLCDLDTYNNVIQMVIEHDKPGDNPVSGFELPGEYNVSLSYGNLKETFLTKLKLTSDFCYQHIAYRCKGSALFDGGVNQFAWWVGVGGNRHDYWAGANDSSPFKCACGLNGNCDMIGYNCNCDIDDTTVMRLDEGNISVKSDLPVKELFFGDTGDAGEEGVWNLGPLICLTPDINGYHFQFETTSSGDDIFPELSIAYEGPGTYQSVEGITGSGLELSGAGVHISGMATPCYSSLLHCQYGFSFTMWAKLQAITSQPLNLFQWTNNNGVELYGVQIECTNDVSSTVICYCEVTLWYNDTVWSSSFNMHKDHWVHIGITWSSEETLNVFINGLNINALGNVSIRSDSALNIMNSTGGKIHIGITFNAIFLIDDLRVVDRFISKEDVRKHLGSDLLCDVGWKLEPSSGQCFAVSSSTLDFTEAGNACGWMDGHLATAERNETLDWIKNMISVFNSFSSIYLSVRQYPRLGHRYRWHDDSVTEIIDVYSTVHRCVVLSRVIGEWVWLPVDCSEKHHFLCQRSPLYISPKRLVLNGTTDTAVELTPSGSLVMSEGILDEAVNLDGLTLKWLLTDECLVNPSFCYNGYGIRFWMFVKPDLGHTFCTLFDSGSAADAGFSAYLESSQDGDVLSFKERLDSQVLTTTFYVTTSSWVHVSLSRYPNQSVLVYLNGLSCQANFTNSSSAAEFNPLPLGFVGEVRLGACLKESYGSAVRMEDLIIVNHILNEPDARKVVLTLLPDNIINYNDLTSLEILGDVSVENGKFEHGLRFAGTAGQCVSAGQYVLDCLGTASACSLGFTLGVWIYPESSTGDYELLSSLNNKNGFAVLFDSLSEVYKVVHRYNGIESGQIVPITIGAWSHLFLTWDSSAGLSLYLNGKLQSGATSNTVLPNTGNFFFPNKLVFGCDRDLSGNFVGFLDDFILIRNNFSSGQVAKEYVRMMYAQTVVEIKFDDVLNTGDTAVPVSTEGVDGLALQFDGEKTWMDVTTNLTSVSGCITGSPTCTGGFTLAFLFNFQGELLETDQYFLSTFGETPDGAGFYFRYTALNKSLPFRRYFEIGYRTDTREYAAWFNLVPKQWLQIFTTWSDLLGLTVYVDGKLVSSDEEGSLRKVPVIAHPYGVILGNSIVDNVNNYGQFLIDHLEFLDYGFPIDKSFLPNIHISGWKHRVLRETVGYSYMVTPDNVSLHECRSMCVADGIASCDMFEFCPKPQLGVCRRMVRGSLLDPNSVPSSSCDLFTSVLISGPDLFVGCYDSHVGDYITILGAESAQLCRAECADYGYDYASIGGKSCSCSNQLPTLSPSSQEICSVPCQDSLDLTCGGLGKMSVYSVTAAREFLNVTVPVTELEVSYLPDSLFLDNEVIAIEINVTASSEAGFKVDFGDGTEAFYSTRTVWSHNYTQPGSYTITVTALNEISTVIMEQTINIMALTTTTEVPTSTEPAISYVSLTHTAPAAFVNSSVNFLLTFSSVDNTELCFVWDFGDRFSWLYGTSSCDFYKGLVNGSSLINPDKVLSVSHTYSISGQFQASVTSFASGFRTDTDIMLEVLNSRCIPPKISILTLTSDLSSPIKWSKSQRVELQSTTIALCDPTQTLLYRWSVYKLNTLGELVLKIPLTDAENSLFMIPPNTLTSGKYFVNVSMHYLNDSDLTVSNSGYLEIKEPSMIAEILGGQKQTVCDGVDLNVVASLQSEQTIRPLPDTDVTIRWICQPFSALCTEMTLQSSAGNPHQIKLPSAILSAGTVYNITVELTVDGNQIFGNQIISVNSCSTNTQHVSSFTNSIGQVNPAEPLKLEAVCSSCAVPPGGIPFMWDLYEVTDGGLLPVIPSPLEVTNETIGMVIPAHTLGYGKNYEVVISSGGTSSTVEIATGDRPFNGTCESSFPSGVAFASEFVFRCTGWRAYAALTGSSSSNSRESLTYKFAYKVRGSSLEPKTFMEVSGYDVSTRINRLRHGIPEYDWIVDISVTITDVTSVSTTVIVPVQIFENPDPLQTLTQTYLTDGCVPQQDLSCTLLVSNGLLDILNDKLTVDGFVPSSADTGGSSGAGGSSGSAGGSTGSGSSTGTGGSTGTDVSDGSESSTTETSNDLVNVISSITRILRDTSRDSNTPGQVEMTVDAVTAIQNGLQYPGLISSTIQVVVSEIIQTLVSKATELFSTSSSTLTSQIGKELMVQSLTQVLSSRHDPNCATVDIIVDNVPAWEVASETNKQRSALQEECETQRLHAEAVNKLLSDRGNLVSLIMAGRIAGEKAQFIAVRPPTGAGYGISYQVERLKIWALSNSALSLNGRVVLYLPDITSHLDPATMQDVDVELFEGLNIYTTHASQEFVKTNMTSATLYNQAETIVVENLQSPVCVFLDTSKLNVNLETHHVDNDKIGEDGYFYHQIILNETGTTVTLTLNTTDHSTLFDLYLGEGFLPTNASHNLSLELPGTIILSSVDDELPNYPLNEWRTRVMKQSSEIISSYENSTWYLGIPLEKYGFEQFDLSLLSGGCAFWDEQLLEWSLQGCEVGPRSWRNVLECQCYHLTTFGGNYFIPPNSIDFSTVFSKFQDLGNNSAVFAIVISILLLYFILLFVMRRKDKKDLTKWAAVPLKDNVVWESYSYLLTVYTGMRSGAGTKSKVYFVLAGDSADTEIRSLEGREHRELSRGSVTSYIMDVNESLGDISYLRIWHDNSGKTDSADWFLKMIVVKDLQTGQSYHLLCDHWLAVDKEEGTIERLIPVASREELTAFRHLFYSTTRHDLPDDHIWMSVFSRPTQSSFTRVQRLSCCVTLLFTTMIANAMWYRQGELVNSSQSIKLGPLVFTMEELITSFLANLVILPVNVIIVTIFRKAKPKPVKVSTKTRNSFSKLGESVFTLNSLASLSSATDKTPIVNPEEDHNSFPGEKDNEDAPQKKGCHLPYWWIYIGWAIVFLSIFISGFFTILYSLEWGSEKAGKWLTAFLLSFVESVILIQPLKILGIAVVLSLIFKKHREDEAPIIDEEHSDTVLAIKKADHRRKYMDNPPAFPDLEKAREEQTKRKRMFGIFKESSIYIFYLVVLSILSYDTRDPNNYRITDSVRTRFVEGKYGFHKVRDVNSFWNWSESVLVPTLFSDQWYNGDSKDSENRLLMGDSVHYRLGPPRLRQLRVSEEACQGFGRYITNVCFGAYGLRNFDSQDYYEGWQLAVNVTENTGPIKSPWTYQDTVSLGGTPITGNMSWYSGGGYLADLGTTRGMAAAAMTYLQRTQWLDRHSRAVFVEVNLYNPNANLFCMLTLILELPPSSAGEPYRLIKTLRLYNYVGPKAIIRICMELLFVGFTLFYLIQFILQLRKHKKAYFKSFWNVINMFNVIGALVSIGAYGAHIVFAKWKLSEFHEDREKFINLQLVALWDEILTSVVGILLFFSMIRLIQMLRFNNKVNMFSGTLKQTFKPLMAFLLVFTLVFVAFAQFGYIVFGREVWDCATFLSCLENQFTMMMMKFNFYEFAHVSTTMAMLYFTFFVLVVAFILVNMLLSILNDTFSFVRKDTTCLADDPMMVDYIMNQFISYFHINKKIGDPSGKPPEQRSVAPSGVHGDDKNQLIVEKF